MAVTLKIHSNGQITLPASLRKEAQVDVGDSLTAEVAEDGSIVLRPAVAVNHDQAYFWTSRWQAGEEAAEKDIQEGRLHRYQSIDEALADLEMSFEFDGSDKIMRNIDDHDACLRNP